MLVLSRRIGEQIVIADDIRVTVVGIKGNQIKLGVIAPPWVTVDRQEVALRRVLEGATDQPHGSQSPCEPSATT
jgi:carbon storage regulator